MGVDDTCEDVDNYSYIHEINTKKEKSSNVEWCFFVCYKGSIAVRLDYCKIPLIEPALRDSLGSGVAFARMFSVLLQFSLFFRLI